MSEPVPERQRYLRASDSDRSLTVDVLADAYADGRLTKLEFDDRADAAVAAKTLGDLERLTVDLAPSSIVLRPTPANPKKVRRLPSVRRAWLWIAPAAVVAVATVVWAITGPAASLVRGDLPPANPVQVNPVPANPVPPVVQPPAAQPGVPNAMYFTLGNDVIPAIDVMVPNLRQTNYTEVGNPGDVSAVTVEYGPGTYPMPDAVMAYTMWLRDFGGFLQGPVAIHVDGVGGVMWRPSVDAGNMIRLEYYADAISIQVKITKGPLNTMLAGLPDPMPRAATSSIGPAGEALTMTPAANWRQYPVWEPESTVTNLYKPGQGMAFGKVVDGNLVGTLVVYRHGYNSPTSGDDSLAAMARSLAIDLLPQPGNLNIPPPTPTTVSGRPAVQFAYQWNDTQFQWYVIQVGQAYYVVLAVVDPSAAGDIDAMVASMVIES